MLQYNYRYREYDSNYSRDIPDYEIEKIDLRDRDDFEEILKKEREESLQTILDPSKFPLFSLKAYLLPNGNTLLQIYIDMLICDASSIGILVERLKDFYNDIEVEPISVTFRDYMLYKNEYKSSNRYQKSLNYWRERLSSLPSAPSFHFEIEPTAIKKPKFMRKQFSLDAKKWLKFQEQ